MVLKKWAIYEGYDFGYLSPGALYLLKSKFKDCFQAAPITH